MQNGNHLGTQQKMLKEINPQLFVMEEDAFGYQTNMPISDVLLDG